MAVVSLTLIPPQATIQGTELIAPMAVLLNDFRFANKPDEKMDEPFHGQSVLRFCPGGIHAGMASLRDTSGFVHQPRSLLRSLALFALHVIQLH
jgi:hypothetical protein